MSTLYIAALVVGACFLLAMVLVDALSGGLQAHEERGDQ